MIECKECGAGEPFFKYCAIKKCPMKDVLVPNQVFTNSAPSSETAEINNEKVLISVDAKELAALADENVRLKKQLAAYEKTFDMLTDNIMSNPKLLKAVHEKIKEANPQWRFM